MKKLYAVVLITITFGFLTFFLNYYTEFVLKSHISFVSHLRDIESSQHKISEDIFENSFLLYPNYDNLDKNMEDIDKIISHMKKEHYKMLKFYPMSHEKLEKYSKFFKKEKEKILEFERLNSILKNSLTYIPSLSIKYLSIAKKPDKKYLTLLTEIVANMLILKNSFDIKDIDIK